MVVFRVLAAFPVLPVLFLVRAAARPMAAGLPADKEQGQEPDCSLLALAPAQALVQAEAEEAGAEEEVVMTGVRGRLSGNLGCVRRLIVFADRIQRFSR